MTTGRINQVAPCGRALRLFLGKGAKTRHSSQSTGPDDRRLFRLIGWGVQCSPSVWHLGLPLHASFPRGPTVTISRPLPAIRRRALFVGLRKERHLPPARPRRQSPPAGLHPQMRASLRLSGSVLCHKICPSGSNTSFSSPAASSTSSRSSLVQPVPLRAG